MDINKIAKEMTREEFLESSYINDKDGICWCPGKFDLKKLPYDICVPKKNCKGCWKNALKAIKFKGEENMENKIDYNREYKIQDILYMKEGLEFIASNEMLYKIKDENLYVYSNYIWIKSENPINKILNMTFKLNKHDKKVSFEEVIKAYGKEIYCIWKDGEDKIKTNYKLTDEYYNFDGDTQYSICIKQIINGEWYIKED